MMKMQEFRTSVRRVVAGIVALAVMPAMAACGSSSDSQSSSNGQSGKVEVVVSINQWESLASQIGGDKAEVTSILSNQNVDAHDFEPQPSDIAKISKAQIVLANGADYDAWATKAAGNSSAAVIDVAETSGAGEGANPHLWFSSEARSAAAKEYLAQLKKADATDSDYFDTQYEKWEKSEDGLKQSIAEAKKVTEGRTYAATESVAYYLAEDLGLKDVTPTGYMQAVTNESEPAPGDLKTFQEMLTSKSASLLLVNTQEQSSTTDLITKAAQKGSVPVVELTESMPSDYSNLTDWVKALVTNIQEKME